MAQWMAEITPGVALVISRRIGISAIAPMLLALLSGCASLPPLQDRPATYALAPDPATPLARSVAAAAEAHPGKTGVIAIAEGRVAFAMRVQLLRKATRSIDIQTYIWRGDATGTLMFDEVVQAAQRGVRVRLLLDDANTSGLDPRLALLAAQPNIEVRLYNPFVARRARGLGLLTDFTRLNHRMHNKSFTVDNVATIVGGRNIADEYFEAGQEKGLVDLDVLAVGEVVPGVSAEFDLYWNSPSAYPARPLLADVVAEERPALARQAEEVTSHPRYQPYVEALRNAPQVKSLLEGTLQFEWTGAHLLYDDPAKTLQTASEVGLLLPQLEAAFGRPTTALDLISPYFVPGESGTDALVALVRRGVRVRVLTNSLAATDVAPVHSGYAKRRVALLQGGVQLLEFKPEATGVEKREHEVGGSSSSAGLHAKTYAVDGRAIFVGSFNLDPRSSKLNTEMGLVIDSPSLARELSAVLDEAFPTLAYRVTLGEDGTPRWADGTTSDMQVEPETGWFKRMIVRIGSWLPVEWLL